MGKVITNIEQVTPAWLTNLLQEKGLLRGKVSEIIPTKMRQTNVSTVYNLSILYSQKERFAPKKLFLKIPSPEFHVPGWGKKEIRFYTEVVPAMRERYSWNNLPFIRHYDVVYAEEINRSHYLFEDVSDAFSAVDGSIPPTYTHREKAIDAFALVHAFWWEYPGIIDKLGDRLTNDTIREFIATAQTKFQDFVAFRGRNLSQKDTNVLEAIVSDWPAKRRERLIAGKGITLVHRDPHPLNLLYSTNNKDVRVKLIDWQSWRIDTGTDDLAYLIACHWPKKIRETEENILLKHYHQRLIQLGVKNYSWPDCRYDYRASIIRCLFFLIAAWSPAQWERGWWWEKVEHGINAFNDYDCLELLVD